MSVKLFGWPDLGPICLQRLWADDTSRQYVRANFIVLNSADLVSVRIIVDRFTDKFLKTSLAQLTNRKLLFRL